ncbi:MAG: glycosyltransferase family 39 protein, partial [Anaerolineae bacterium]|nr:glycosyltransferase family 39 protein [Anaerolineae bacterium]
MTSNSRSRRAAPSAQPRLLWLAIVLTTAAAAYLLPEGGWRYPAVFLLLWVLPGLAWHRREPAGNLVSALGLGMLLTTLLTLLLALLPGPLPQAALLAGATLLALLAALIPHAPTETITLERHWPVVAALAVVLLLAAFLRVTLLGYKEFQGDEGIVLQRAAAILLGDDAQLFRHQKGPVEILIPLATWRLNGLLHETTARLPFTFAGLLAIPALIVTARRWLPLSAALVAGLFLAVNGFATAFSRIVQYQSFVLLWGVLSLYHADVYRQKRNPGDLVLAAAFLAGGLLAHYDAVLFAPAVVWLLLPSLARPEQRSRGAWGAALLTGLLIAGSFYLPYALSPAFSGTSRYLLQERIGGTLWSWSGGRVWQMATLYNDTYSVVVLLLLAVAGIWQLRRQPALLLVFAIPFLFYTVVVVDPRTHIYTLGPGVALLAAAGFIAVWRAQKWLGAATLGLLAVISTVYLILLFIDSTPERQRTWETNAPRLYGTTWDEPPQYGLFGFPHQAGWRLAAGLVDAFP